ncbi:TetR/AcrR family transcriptional regulator [Silvibacterium acidisoli]|uniref:TetR/AcrR family transcriptional regulator n=1 Tax=Acidobacteriaceae bacterium ZG23-2 TaxID=2883246 RepID=UPI00406D2418
MVRTAPRQERSERRLAGFLDVAGKLFAEAGYEGLTMTEVAALSGSSIGALYNYFPDKQSLAFTLAKQYVQELEARWKPLIEQAGALTHAEFAGLFIDRITEFVRERPAYLKLVAAPVRFRRDPAARKASRLTIAKAFLAQHPQLAQERALLIANVTIQIVTGMMAMYEDADQTAKTAVVDEFKKVLASYLENALPATRSKQPAG